MKKFIIILTVMVMLLGSINAFAENILPEGTIVLHLGSPLILSNGNMKAMDSENPNVVPVIHKDRTLVPLRAISENFGAEVSYNESAREAIIKYKNKTYTFPIDKNYYRVQEKDRELITVTFDTESLIMQNRTMVPFRVICEDVIGKTVGYSDRVITVSDEQIVLNNILINEIKNKIGQAIKVASLAELNNIVASINENNERYYTDGIAVPELAPVPSAAEAAKSNDAQAVTTDSNDFSSTNEQVAGVNEADIVKTDGKFIYVASGKSIRIYKANNGKPVLASEIAISVDSRTGQYVQLSEIYIDNGRLIVLGSRNSFNNWIRPVPVPMNEKMISMPFREGRSYTYCGIYSIDENGKNNLIKEVEVEGTILSSRKKDNIVYLIVNKYLYNYGIYGEGIVPMYKDTVVSKDYEKMSIDSIMYYPQRRASNYLIIAAIDIENSEEPAEIEAFLGSGNLVYMSNNALYVAGQDYNTIWGTITNVAKFTINGTKIGFAGGGMVDGTILNQFSMDEYEGNLRIATTNWQNQSSNALYILDNNLNKIGAVENIAPGEKIYSVRFMGEKGYIVTFRQIDPLFVLDLSNPKLPKITGELKVPGFSNYLHPINEDILLGIGQDVDEKTGRQQGIKLSVFDVSDQGKPRELNNLILGGSGSYAEVLNNHKALMLNSGKEMIAFDASLSNIYSDYAKEYFNGAVIVEVTKTGDINLLKQISNEGIYGSNVKRIVYIGDVLYYIIDENIRAFHINNFEEIR